MISDKDEKDKKAQKCNRCGTRGAVYHQMGLNLCRRCFREIAAKMGFKKYE